MMRDLRVLFVPCSNAGVSYYRQWLWNVAACRNRAFLSLMPWFQYEMNTTHPWEVDLADPRHAARIKNELWSHFLRCDAVVFQMVHTKPALDLFLAMKEAAQDSRLQSLRENQGISDGVPPVILAEIDDNMLSTADYNPAAAFYNPGSEYRQLAVEQFKSADGMIVSTRYLADEVYRDTNPDISVVHNSIDFEVWNRVRKKSNGKIVRIGWMGGASHDEDLRIVEPVVKSILAKHKNVRFTFVHGAPEFLKNIPGVEIVSKFSRIDRYPQFLGNRGFDIGIAPLVDNAFNRGKSNLRWLEYAGMQVPCVASNVGHFKETLRNGEDALLADSPADFEAALESLILDRNKRKALGQSAYRRALQDFNVDRNIFVYEKILRDAVERGQKKIYQPEYAAPIAEERISAPGVYS